MDLVCTLFGIWCATTAPQEFRRDDKLLTADQMCQAAKVAGDTCVEIKEGGVFQSIPTPVVDGWYSIQNISGGDFASGDACYFSMRPNPGSGDTFVLVPGQNYQRSVPGEHPKMVATCDTLNGKIVIRGAQ